MADREVRIAILGDSRDFQKAMKDASSSSDTFEGRTRGLGGFLKDHFAITLGDIAGGLQTLAGAASGAIKAAADDDRAQRTLARTLRNTTGATDAQIASVEDFIGGLQDSTGVLDDELRPAMDTLVRGTGDVSKAQELMGLAMDIAAGTGKDLGSVTDALAKAQNGNVRALRELAPEMTGLIREGASADEVFGNLASTFAGQAAVAADTTAGRMAIMHAGLADVQEQVGTALLPAMEALSTFLVDVLIPAFESLTAWTEEHWPEIKATIEKNVQGIVDFVKPIIEDLKAFWRTFGDTITRFAKETWEGIRKQIEGTLQIIKGIVDVFVGIFTGDWGRAWDGIKGIVSGAWLAIQGAVEQTLARIRLLFEASATILGGVWSGVWETIKKAPGEAFDAIVGFLTDTAPGMITGAASGMWDGLWQAFKGALNKIIDLWNGIKVPTLKIGGFDPLGDFGPSIPDVKIGGWSFPQIPRLADGGIVKARPGGTLALLGEGGRDEAVMPLDPLSGVGGPSIVQHFNGVFDPEQVSRLAAEEMAWAVRAG